MEIAQQIVHRNGKRWFVAQVKMERDNKKSARKSPKLDKWEN